VAALVLASCAPSVEKEVPQSRFEGIEIYFIAGAAGDPFQTVVSKGLADAVEDFGVDLKVVFTGWDTTIMIEKFKEAVALEPDGIIVWGLEPIKPHIDEAIAKGIIVTTWGVPLQELEDAHAAQGLGYVGASNYPAGYKLATETARRFNLGPGDKAMVWGLLHQPVRGLRSKGCIEGLEEAGLTVDYLEITDAVNADPAAGIPVIAAYLAANPDTDVVVTDHGGMTSTLPEYLESAGYGPDEILGVGFDFTPVTVRGIQSGYIDLILDQQQYLEGYLSVLNVCLTKYGGFSGLHIDSGAGFGHAENIDFIIPLAEAGIR